MANELNWLRSKATHRHTDMMVVTPEQAVAAECAPGTYKIDLYAFTGTVPFRMAKGLRGAKLVKTEEENETLHLGSGYVGGEGQCRYYRTTYTLVSA